MSSSYYLSRNCTIALVSSYAAISIAQAWCGTATGGKCGVVLENGSALVRLWLGVSQQTADKDKGGGGEGQVKYKQRAKRGAAAHTIANGLYIKQSTGDLITACHPAFRFSRAW